MASWLIVLLLLLGALVVSLGVMGIVTIWEATKSRQGDKAASEG